ncbi:hypothetical protein IT775_02905 [Thalassobius aquimarinus]|uniref:Uncharacterized protein n=1 Tax=Thalassovita aquimarina TaxID=2785917 RepID=A0ABS5HM67_9RHOB|nr:hypothetical protein [Thalassovita aquimarina]
MPIRKMTLRESPRHIGHATPEGHQHCARFLLDFANAIMMSEPGALTDMALRGGLGSVISWRNPAAGRAPRQNVT